MTWPGTADGAMVVKARQPGPPSLRNGSVLALGRVAPGSQRVHLPPGLAPFEGGDTGSYNGTTIAESFLLDGDRELDVTINQPASGPGSRFSLAAFVTLVQQVRLVTRGPGCHPRRKTPRWARRRAAAPAAQRRPRPRPGRRRWLRRWR